MRNLVAVLAALMLAGTATAQEMAPDGARITVTGEGRVTAVPDMATLTLGVSAEAAEAKAAMDQTSEGVAALLERLAAAAVEARDIQTSGLSLGPVWRHSNDGSQPPQITGYSATNTVTVRVRDMDRLGGLLDQALEGGVNTLHGVGFGLQDPEPRMDEARVAAVEDALRKAELYARAARVTLGPILSISEGGGMPGPQPMYREAAMSASVPVAAGETEVLAQVIITWQIAP